MTAVALKVGGVAYDGWKSIRVTRSIEAISGSFSLTLAEKWAGQTDRWPIYEGDECEVEIGGAPVLSGYVDSREISYSASDHSLTVSGRDKTGDLVDCSAVMDRWQFSKTAYPDIIKALCAPFGISVSIAGGVSFQSPPAQFAINPGETCFEAIDRICRLNGVVPVSDGIGGLLLTKAGTELAAGALVYGENILSGSGSFSQTERFRRYIVSGQQPGTDDFFGEQAASVKAEASDENARAGRVLYVRPEGNATQAICQQRAGWEAVVRAGRSGRITYTVQGWLQQKDGALWEPNFLVPVRDPVMNVSDNMLITEVTYAIDDTAGEIAQLTLKRPDAFTPEVKTIAAETDPWLTGDDLE